MASIINPDLGRLDKFNTELHHYPLTVSWKKLIGALAVAGACIGAAGVTVGSTGAIAGAVVALLCAVVLCARALGDHLVVRDDECGDLVGLVKRVEAVGGLTNYNNLVVPHFHAIRELRALLDRLEHAAGKLGGHRYDAVITGRRLAWGAAVRRRSAAFSVPAPAFMQIGEHWEDHHRHLDAARRLTAELTELTEAVELAAATAQVTEHPDALEHRELAVIAAAEQVRAELAAYSELDPTQHFTRLLSAAEST